MTTPARNNLWLSKSALDSATPKKLYPLGVSFWPYQMRFERIGSYDVTALIGEGGMGRVYQATEYEAAMHSQCGSGIDVSRSREAARLHRGDAGVVRPLRGELLRTRRG